MESFCDLTEDWTPARAFSRVLSRILASHDSQRERQDSDISHALRHFVLYNEQNKANLGDICMETILLFRILQIKS